MLKKKVNDIVDHIAEPNHSKLENKPLPKIKKILKAGSLKERMLFHEIMKKTSF